MNATPLLTQIAQALKRCRLEAVLIGNAAAALHGAPVTTLDFDFMFRATPANLRKLMAFAKQLDASAVQPYYPVVSGFLGAAYSCAPSGRERFSFVPGAALADSLAPGYFPMSLQDRTQGAKTETPPYYPASGLYRVINDRIGLQVDFMAKVDGVNSFAGLRARAETVEFAGYEMLVAPLEDVLASKKAADRPQDRAVVPILERTLNEKGKAKNGQKGRASGGK